MDKPAPASPDPRESSGEENPAGAGATVPDAGAAADSEPGASGGARPAGRPDRAGQDDRPGDAGDGEDDEYVPL